MVTALYAAFPFGGLIGGLSSAFLIPHFGWSSIFYIGGIAPILIALLLMVALPESLRFMLVQGRRPDEIRRILDRIAPGAVGPEGHLTSQGMAKHEGLPVKHLFTEGRAGRTLLLWVPFFMVFMVLVSVSAWTPTVLRTAGLSLSAGALILSMNNLGSTVGNASAGYLIDRFGPFRILVPAFVLGALCLALFGRLTSTVASLAIVSTGIGFFVGGASAGMIALAATTYPTFMRSTGIGWAMGIGRFGQIFGPLGFGVLVGWNWGVDWIFYAAAIPCLIGAGFVLLLKLYDAPSQPHRVSAI